LNNLNKINIDEYKPLRDLVFKNLRNSILNGDFYPGQRLMEIQIAQSLGVSRTPVREAIRKLELEGFVVMLPRKGAYVADISLKEIKEVLEVRASLEGLAAYLATDRISEDEIKHLEKIVKSMSKDLSMEEFLMKDVEFHEYISKASSNKKLHSIINSLWEQVYRFRVTYISDDENIANIIKEHKLILEAIKSRNSSMAKRYAKEHIEKSEKFIIDKTLKK